MHAMTNQVGEELTVLDGAPAREEIRRRIASVSAGRFRRPVLVLDIDRAYVDLQEGSCDKTSFVLLRIVWISVPTFGTGTFAVKSPTI